MVIVCVIAFGAACGFYLKISMLALLLLASIVCVWLIPQEVPYSIGGRTKIFKYHWGLFLTFTVPLVLAKIVRWIV